SVGVPDVGGVGRGLREQADLVWAGNVRQHLEHRPYATMWLGVLSAPAEPGPFHQVELEVGDLVYARGRIPGAPCGVSDGHLSSPGCENEAADRIALGAVPAKSLRLEIFD